MGHTNWIPRFSAPPGECSEKKTAQRRRRDRSTDPHDRTTTAGEGEAKKSKLFLDQMQRSSALVQEGHE
ncbi:Hypothetical predicted protein, partial [Podarcis lilfordi]